MDFNSKQERIFVLCFFVDETGMRGEVFGFLGGAYGRHGCDARVDVDSVSADFACIEGFENPHCIYIRQITRAGISKRCQRLAQAITVQFFSKFFKTNK